MFKFCQCQDFPFASESSDGPSVPNLSGGDTNDDHYMIIWQITALRGMRQYRNGGKGVLPRRWVSAVNCVERRSKEYAWRITLRRSPIRSRTQEKWGERFLLSRWERLGQEEHELCISRQVAHLCHLALNVTCVEWNLVFEVTHWEQARALHKMTSVSVQCHLWRTTCEWAEDTVMIGEGIGKGKKKGGVS